MFFSQCLQHNCNLFELESFYFRDTLPILRAMGGHVADGCARLQCLARCCNFFLGGRRREGNRAQRASEDTVVLRTVAHYCAGTLGLTSAALLCRFVCNCNVNATLVAPSFVCLYILPCYCAASTCSCFREFVLHLLKKNKHKYDIIVPRRCEAF